MARITRRDLLAAASAAALGAGTASAAPPNTKRRLRGALLILHTPFAADGTVDWDDLVRETQFVDRSGASAVVWPQGSSSVGTLTREERLRGMEVLADATRGREVALVLGVQGADTAEMLVDEIEYRYAALAPYLRHR